jgi:hypothetical protein
VREARLQHGEAVAAAARRAGQVDDERRAEDPATPRESSACGVFAASRARIASAMPGASRSSTDASPRA